MSLDVYSTIFVKLKIILIKQMFPTKVNEFLNKMWPISWSYNSDNDDGDDSFGMNYEQELLCLESKD